MQMIDVMKKLRDITDKSPEVVQAMDNISRMNAPVAEGVEIKTSGDDAVLAQILKLAGMVGGVNSPDMTAAPGDMPGGPMGGLGPDPMSDMTPSVPMDMPVDHHMDKPTSVSDLSKLAGIGAPDDHSDNLPAIIPGEEPSMGDMGEPMDMDMDMEMGASEIGADTDDGDIAAVEAEGNRPYPNSPHEVTSGIDASIPDGNDLNKSKLTAPKVAGGDNPLHVAVTFD
jgi:hypothetical protein